MSVSAGSIMNQAAVCLNDADKNTYTFAVLLPHLQMAAKSLQLKCQSASMSIIKDIQADTDVDAHDVLVSPPDDLFIPIELFERAQGSTDESEWSKMDQRTWDPNIPEQTSLLYWTWREGQFHFPDCAFDREIRIRYFRNFDAIVDQNTNVFMPNAEVYLIYRTARNCAKYTMGMPKFAAELNMDAQEALNDILNIEVKTNQGGGVRRRPFGISRRIRSRMM